MIIYILLIHWIADFVLQTKFMAYNKSRSLYALGLHVGVYLCTFIALLLPVLIFTKIEFSDIVLFCVFNSLMHLVIDFITSRLAAVFYTKGDTHNFFVVIGFDQFLHLSLLIFSMEMLNY